MTEIKKKNNVDLEKLVNEKRESLRKLRFESAGSGMRSTHAMSTIRREIARLLTELNHRTKIDG